MLEIPCNQFAYPVLGITTSSDNIQLLIPHAEAFRFLMKTPAFGREGNGVVKIPLIKAFNMDRYNHQSVITIPSYPHSFLKIVVFKSYADAVQKPLIGLLRLEECQTCCTAIVFPWAVVQMDHLEFAWIMVHMPHKFRLEHCLHVLGPIRI